MNVCTYINKHRHFTFAYQNKVLYFRRTHVEATQRKQGRLVTCPSPFSCALCSAGPLSSSWSVVGGAM